jgi:lipoate-protein ligase B
MSKPVCIVHRLGLVPYQQAWDLQKALATEIAAGVRPATLLLLEHPHAYTFGRRGDRENLLWDQIELGQRGIEIHWVDRGGDVTYHGPGQLVGYPLLPLGTPQMTVSGDSAHLPQADYVGYIRRLEQVIITALASLGVDSRQVRGLTGVWVQLGKNAAGLSIENPPNLKLRESNTNSSMAKIAAIGIKVDAKGISRHGFALNVNPDMSYWEGIIGCGLIGYPVTSLAQQLTSIPPMGKVMEALVRTFGKVYDYDMREEYL